MIKRFLCTSFCLLMLHGVFAVDLELTQGTNAALPVGINAFGTDPAAKLLRKVIQDDLTFSGQFNVIQPMVTEPISSAGYWQRAGADSVISGQVNQLGGNRIDVRLELREPVGQALPCA